MERKGTLNFAMMMLGKAIDDCGAGSLEPVERLVPFTRPPWLVDGSFVRWFGLAWF